MTITVSDENTGTVTWTLPDAITEAIASKHPAVRGHLEQLMATILEEDTKLYASIASCAVVAMLAGGKQEGLDALRQALRGALSTLRATL